MRKLCYQACKRNWHKMISLFWTFPNKLVRPSSQLEVRHKSNVFRKCFQNIHQASNFL